VTGILGNVPNKSHLQFDVLSSMSSYDSYLKPDEWKWIWTGFSTYGLVKEGTDIAALTKKIQAIPPKWAGVTTERIFNQTFDEYTAGKPWTLYLQPLEDLYLSTNPWFHRFGPNGDKQIIKVFSVVGVLVLILSGINFMNLSTARSTNRAKEVGIRKVLGSRRKSLIRQFMFESILFVSVSTIAALLLVQLSLDVFNNIAETQLALIPFLNNPVFISIVIAFILVLGVLAGSYPAFYLSSFNPIQTLKGKMSAGFKGKGVRNGLVIFQFSISIALIICTFFVQKQLQYTSSLDLGLDQNNVLQIHNIKQLDENDAVLKSKLEANPAIVSVGKSFSVPPFILEGERYKGSQPNAQVIDIGNMRTEGAYLDLIDLEFIEGRNFDKAISTDKYAVILNEAAVKALGWGTSENYISDSPIDKTVFQAFDEEREFEVIGVVKDFNFTSAHDQIGPLMILHMDNDQMWNFNRGSAFLSIRIASEVVKDAKGLQNLLEELENEMSQIDASILFEYSFLDQEFEDTFRYERRMGIILNMFTAMAMIIACLGLFGLAAFSAESRLKELGIRKVLGAKVSQLVYLFSTEFSKLILISVLLASPIAYFLVNSWLDDFPYRTAVEVWVFVVAAIGALLIAMLTTGFQSLKAAHKNPTETLKSE
jgi:putative ABC transport system permease protein